MKNKSAQIRNAFIAKVLVVVMVMLSVMVIPPSEANAATGPKLTKTSRNILIGKQYDLNIANKVKGSAYVWTTSNKKVATVTNKGVVTGVDKGTAVITCKVETPKNTYTLKAKVTIIQKASRVKIKNKITAINVGQEYDLNRMLIPSYSNEKTYWSSSDTSIADPDKYGKFTALKTGTVTITAKTTSGLTDSATISVIDADGTVTTQEELSALLSSGAPVITIKTEEEVNLTIPAGDYSKTKLVVEAPNADIINYGVFASVDIKEIKADTWREEAVGNLLNIFAAKSRVVVGSKAKCSIEVSEKGAVLTIENNGKIEKVTISKEAAEASLELKGDSKQDIPVVVSVSDVKLTTSVPLKLECEKKLELVVLPGAEKTQVTAKTEDAVPDVKGSVTLEVKIGTGEDSKTATVTGAPIPTAAPTPSTAPSSGENPGGNDPSPYETQTFTLEQSFMNLSAVKVSYAGIDYDVDSGMLNSLKYFLTNDQATITKWNNIEDTTKTYSEQTVQVTGQKGSATKKVEFTSGLLKGRSYSVTVYGSSSMVMIKSLSNNKSYTVKKVDDKTLTIYGLPVTVKFYCTY